MRCMLILANPAVQAVAGVAATVGAAGVAVSSVYLLASLSLFLSHGHFLFLQPRANGYCAPSQMRLSCSPAVLRQGCAQPLHLSYFLGLLFTLMLPYSAGYGDREGGGRGRSSYGDREGGGEFWLQGAC